LVPILAASRTRWARPTMSRICAKIVVAPPQGSWSNITRKMTTRSLQCHLPPPSRAINHVADPTPLRASNSIVPCHVRTLPSPVAHLLHETQPLSYHPWRVGSMGIGEGLGSEGGHNSYDEGEDGDRR